MVSLQDQNKQMTLIDNLNWRYATKKFDPSKQINMKDLDFLKESIRLSASSYGLQPFKVMIIDSKETKEKLKPLSYNQSQIADASHLFLFCNLTEVSPEYIDQYIELSAKTRDLEVDNFSRVWKLYEGGDWQFRFTGIGCVVRKTSLHCNDEFIDGLCRIKN